VTAEIVSLPWAGVWARRLDRHGLSDPAPDARLAGVVGAMCGAHAQVLSAAELSIGLRTAGATRADVRHALWTERSLVKTFGPRGTVHLLPTAELPLWLGALSAIPPIPRSLPEPMRMTAEQVDAVVAAVAAALDEAELTTAELDDAVVAGAGAWAGDLVMPAFQGMWPRWRQVIPVAAHRGVLCFGPNRGRNITYTSPRRWLPGLRPADGPTALAGLVRRYLHAYGPATPEQFARWLNAPPRWTAELFDSLAGDLERVDVQGTVGWVPAGDTVPATPADGVHLLPYFDAYTVGCYPRELLYPGPAADRVPSTGRGGNFQVLLVGGTVAGLWHQRRSGRRVEITVEPLVDLGDAPQRALADQVARVGEVLEAVPAWTFGTVPVGAHA